MHRSLVALALAALALPAAAQLPPSTAELAKLAAPDAHDNDRFGSAVAADGDVLAVGAPQFAGASGSGKLYIYRRVAGAWTLEAGWLPVTAGLAQLGGDVAVSGDRVVAGAQYEFNSPSNAGGVYVYHHDGVSWSQEAHLVQYDAVNATLGAGVAIDGDVIVAGAPQEVVGGVQSGAARVFRLVGGVWTLEATLAPGDVTHQVDFGRAVAVEGDLIVVGARSAPGVASGSGAAYVYERVGGVWTLTDKLVGSSLGAALPHQFGNDVDVDAGRVVVASYAFMGVFEGSGLVYEYRKVGGVWTETAHVECCDAAPYSLFGKSLDLDGSRLLVGATGVDGAWPDSGAAYLFEEVGGQWLERKRLVASDSTSSYVVGDGVALTTGEALVGAAGDTLARGAVYAFDDALPAPVGSAYCFGDGSGTPCPCGNDAPLGSGRGCVNGTGQGAWLELVGSTSVAAADLAPYARDIAPKQPCLLFAGLNAVNGGAGQAFGDGLRCAGGSVVRLGVGSGGATGVVAWSPAAKLGLTWVPGTTVRLQAWYRDPAAGPCAQGFNLTNGVELALAP